MQQADQEVSANNYGQINLENEFIVLNDASTDNLAPKGGVKTLSQAEESIVKSINVCLKNWNKPWLETFLAGSREFKVVYDLMEDLLHYEYQITNTDSILSSERTSKIARAVARLADYGNAILNIDLIVRFNDETSSEIDPINVTTIELYQLHVKAHNLREKLLYDYFKKDKPSLPVPEQDTASLFNGLPQPTPPPPPPLPSSPVSLQVPLTSNHQLLQHSPTSERSQKFSAGSNTSINTLSDGRRTPQFHSNQQPQIELRISSQNDLSGEIEVTHMMATIRSSAFTSSHTSATRMVLLPGILAKIKTLMSVPTSAEKLTCCFELLDSLLDSIERLPVESRNREVVMIARELLKPIVGKVYIDNRDNLVELQHAHWATCLTSIVRLMSATDFNTYLSHFSNQVDSGAFLKDYLFIVKRLTSARHKISHPLMTSDLDNINNSLPIYPDCWIEMTLLASSTFLTSLTYLYQILRQFFGTNLKLWLSFVDCLVHFILQDALEPNRNMLKKRQHLLAEDLRQTSAEYIWISWDSLGIDQRQELLDDLVEPLLHACMTLRTKQRSILLPIFYSMMRCDYASQYISPRGSICNSTSSTLYYRENVIANSSQLYEDDLESLPPINGQQKSTMDKPTNQNESMPYLSCIEFTRDGTVLTKFTHLIVGRLNNLMIDLELGDESFKSEFCAAISGELNPKYHSGNSFSLNSDMNQFKSMAKHTSELIAEFIQICLDSRQANKLSYKHLYLLCLFKLIQFFRDKVDRCELYLNYLYKLCCLHHAAGRFAEAGYTLLEHAKALPWSNKPLENHFRVISRFFHASQQWTDYTSLKVFLYNRIIEYFDQGKIWEAALPICRELMDFYQFKTYEYDKLAEILSKMSTYFNNITDATSRNNPEYFRVTLYGNGFLKCIRNSTMVYRGKPYEKLGDFQATILTKYPDAKLLASLAKPDESTLNDLDARYLQINACSPVVDLQSKFDPEAKKIDDSIMSYYRHNECDKFSFSRRISRPENEQQVSDDEFANVWREKTTLTTNTLPGILPFFPVFLIETQTVTPIESAIEDLERTNNRLSSMVNRFKADKNQREDVRLLGQLLLGVVDAAVNGGITKYEEAFFQTTTKTKALELERADWSEGKKNDQVSIDRLKSLIANQVPLLDEAIRIHRDRVADVMRPQQEHLEVSYEKLKHHVMSKYSRYLPRDYSRSTFRTYRSLPRSPNRSTRIDSRSTLIGSNNLSDRYSSKRMSDVGHRFPLTATVSPTTTNMTDQADEDESPSSSKMPYKRLDKERRSLPFLSGTPFSERALIRDAQTNYSTPVKNRSDIKLDAEQDDEQSLIDQPVPARRTLLAQTKPIEPIVSIIDHEDKSQLYVECVPVIVERHLESIQTPLAKNDGDGNSFNRNQTNYLAKQDEFSLI